MKLKHFLFASSLSILLFSSCKHESFVPDNAPVMSFNSDVQPILTSNCTASGCHGTVSPVAPLLMQDSLLSYNKVMELVQSGKPDNSQLIKVITALNDDVMPKKPTDPLTEEQTKVIYLWILQGAKNN